LAGVVDSSIIKLSSRTFISLANAEIGGSVLYPQYYERNSAATLTGDIILDGAYLSGGVWIIKINGAFTTAINSNVILRNGAEAKNIFWIVDGAHTLGTDSTFQGVLFGKAAVNLGTNSDMTGRVYTSGGLITVNSGANISTVTPDTSGLLSLDLLSEYMIFNSNGNITRGGTTLTNASKILTRNGIISNFGAPYDGTYIGAPYVSQVWADIMMYNDNVITPEASRCVQDPISQCHEVNHFVNIVCIAGAVVEMKARVIIENTSCSFLGRGLNLTRVYV
jgi:hypothetical protein